MVVNEERKVSISFTDEEVAILRKAKEIFQDIYEMDLRDGVVHFCEYDSALIYDIYDYIDDFKDYMED